MYYWSGTDVIRAWWVSGQPDAACCIRSSEKWCNSRHLERMTSYQAICLRQSMRIHWRNNPAKFYPNAIWNNGVLDFFEDGRPNNKKNNNKKTRWVAILGQFLMLKVIVNTAMIMLSHLYNVCSSFGEYLLELKSGQLLWSPLHTSDKFWAENAHRLMAKKNELLKYLTSSCRS